MAKITVLERDLSTAVSSEGLSNIVYVPGYSIKGPTNTPVLCRTYSEFINTFGATPYKFLTDQEIIPVGGFEKSYTYAAELVRLGLPILFERITSLTNSNKAEKTIYFRNRIFTGISPLFEGESPICYKAVGTPKVDNTGIDWTVFSGETLDAIETPFPGSYEIEINEARTVITLTIDPGETPLIIPMNNIITISEEDSTYYFEIVAKYVGRYGNDIVTSLIELEEDPSEGRLFKLTIDGIDYNISFNVNSTLYIAKVFENNAYVDINDINIIEAYIENDMYDIIDYTNQNLVLSLGIDEDEVTLDEIIDAMKGDESTDSCFEKLKSKEVYDVKFITSGAYGNLALADSVIARNMLDTASSRGDALALIDIKKGIEKSSYLDLVTTELPTSASANGEDVNLYGTLIAPYVKVDLITLKKADWMPGSFIYLKSLANSIKTNPIWFAIAGVNRGNVLGFKEIEFDVTGTLLDSWQSDIYQNINPIMNVRPYGYCIYGNRTLKRNVSGLTASSFTNIRLLINEVKKLVIQSASSLTFENNDIILWNSFKALIEPTLDRMKSNRGLTDYKIIRGITDKKATIVGTVRLMPIEATENFEINFSIEDNAATVV